MKTVQVKMKLSTVCFGSIQNLSEVTMERIFRTSLIKLKQLLVIIGSLPRAEFLFWRNLSRGMPRHLFMSGKVTRTMWSIWNLCWGTLVLFGGKIGWFFAKITRKEWKLDAIFLAWKGADALERVRLSCCCRMSRFKVWISWRISILNRYISKHHVSSSSFN